LCFARPNVATKKDKNNFPQVAVLRKQGRGETNKTQKRPRKKGAATWDGGKGEQPGGGGGGPRAQGGPSSKISAVTQKKQLSARGKGKKSWAWFWDEKDKKKRKTKKKIKKKNWKAENGRPPKKKTGEEERAFL